MGRTLLALASTCAAACAGPPHPATAPASIAPAVDVPALLEAHENFGGTLSPDGTRVVFRSDRDGVAELYVAEVAEPDGPAKKIVAGPERIASGVFAHDGRSLLFRRDTGADENFHVLRVPVDGGEPVDLTPTDPMWRDSPLVPRDRADVIVYGARKPTDYASMIIVQELDGGAQRVAYRDPGAGAMIDVLPDASAALWFREATTGGHEVLEIDLATGQARPIEPRDGAAEMVTAAAYSADGSRIFVATDHGGEHHVVVALDRATLAELATYPQTDPPTAEVSAIVPSPRGDRVAITIDAGNHSTVRLLDATTLATLVDIRTPLGTAAVGTNSETRVRNGTGVFAADGMHFAINVSLPDAPEDIYLVDTLAGEARPVRDEPRAALAKLPAIATSIANVKSFDGLVVPVNVYVPAGATTRMPTMVWLHGGPDASTSIEWNAWNRIFAAAGVVVLEPNIRGSTGFGRAYARADDREKRWDALRDLAAINAWARAQPWCDPQQIVIAGASFGGYYTLMALAHQPDLWSAGVDLAGPSDLHTLLTAHAMPERYVAEVGDPVADAKLIADLSPIHDVARVVAPLFVYQGANDDRVPRVHADTIVAALRARGVRVDYMLAGDEGHSVARRANEIELLGRLLVFIRSGPR
ncbi:MAG TPA: prolyl oligopeptidase family serine peptidase [Kofleriaceae bacterium]|nr:prolyl oligopeptidase family serine peptidase [Kofleriaceae bacterium]